MVSQLFKSLGDFTQMAAEAVPDWIRYSWPSESAYKNAGSPSLAYAEWQKVQQPFSAGAQASVYTNPVLAPAVDAPPPIAFEAPPEFVSGATAATSRLNSPAVETAPLAPVDPAGVIPNFLGGVNQALSPEGAQAGYGFAPQAAAPPPGLLEKALGFVANQVPGAAADAVSAVGNVPLGVIPGAGGLGAALDIGGKDPTIGGAAQFALDERGNPVSRFIADEIRPRAADAGEAFGNAFGNTAAGVGLNATLGVIGLADDVGLVNKDLGINTGDIGRAVGEYGTPVSPLDLTLSLFVPATADWADAYRLLKGSSLIDDAGRILPGVTRPQLDNLLRSVGRSVDELPELPIGAADALVRGTPVDQGTDAARLLSGPGVGKEIPAPRPGIAGAADEAADDLAKLATPDQSVTRPLGDNATVEFSRGLDFGDHNPPIVVDFDGEPGLNGFRALRDQINEVRGRYPDAEVWALPTDARRTRVYKAAGFEQHPDLADGMLRLPREGGGQFADEATTAGRATPPAGTAAEVPPSGAATSAAPASPPPPRGPATAVADVPPGGVPPTGATPTGATPNDPGFAGNIRLEKYPEEIRDDLKVWSDANPDAVEQARRGTRSDELVREDARELVELAGGDFDKRVKDWKPGEAWNAEETMALRGVLLEKTQAVQAAALAARESGSSADYAKLVEALGEQQRVQEVVTGVTAEAGRALRQFRFEPDALAGPAESVRRYQDFLKRTLGTSDPEKLAEYAEAISKLDMDDPRSIMKFVRDVRKPGLADYLKEVWYNGVLSGPWTHMRNGIGNMTATITDPVRRLNAAGIETAAARLQGREAERFWQEAPAAYFGVPRGFLDGVRAALRTILDGVSPSSLARADSTMRTQAFTGKFGRFINFPSTMLEAGDEFFKAINYRMNVSADALRMARREGLKGDALQERIAKLIADPPPELIRGATARSEEMLFRGHSEVASALTKFKNTSGWTRPLDYVIPFVRTPQNLLKYGFKYSPAGLLDVPQWRRILAGNPEGADEIAKSFVGSMIAASFGAAVATGQMDITAGVPTNAGERDRFFREGKLPFAIKIGGTWIQYNQIPGMDVTLLGLAVFTDAVRSGKNPGDAASQFAATIGQSLMDKSYLSGVSGLLDAVGSPEQFASRFVARTVSGFIPYSALMRQVNQETMDRTVRDPGSSFTDNIKSGLPVLSEQVRARQTAFGTEISRGIPAPIRISRAAQMRVDAALEEAGVEVGFVGDSVAGQALNDEQQYYWQRARGRAVYSDLYNLVMSRRFQTLTPSTQAVLLDDAVNKADAIARNQVKSLVDSKRFQTLSPETQQKLITDKLKELGNLSGYEDSK